VFLGVMTWRERGSLRRAVTRDGVVDRDGLADAASDRVLAPPELDLAEVQHGQVTPGGPRLVPARW
jgi:hypothetical protein